MKSGNKRGMFTYALMANIASSLVALLATFFIPKYFGDDVEQYGMQQIFVFYTGYIGLFHFGLCDGLYLREGGKKYEDIDKKIYSSQFRVLLILLVVEATIVIFGYRMLGNEQYLFIVFMVALNLIIQNLYAYFMYILQSTGQIKYYAISQIIGNIAYSLLLVGLFVIRKVDYKLVIGVYTLSQFFILLSYLYRCRAIVLAKPAKLPIGIKEVTINIKIGCQLLIANIASNLINGIVRFGIQKNWDVAIYGQISLTISISNILLLFVSAVSMVLYPILRREKEQRHSEIYQKLRGMLMIFLFGGMILYYPIIKIAEMWLPNYKIGLQFMALLFPICCYSAKMSMIILTYMKVFRLERKILYVNVSSVVVSGITTFISCFIFNNLAIAMFAMVFNQAFRCVFAEIILARHMNYKPYKDIFIEAMMTIGFIFASWIVGGFQGLCIYVIIYIVYVIIYRKNIYSWIGQIRYGRRLVCDKKNN